VPCLDNQAEIWRQSTVVGKASSLVILVGRRDIVRQLARSLLNFTLIIWLSVVLVLLGESLGFVNR
jgi:hypothetical protein